MKRWTLVMAAAALLVAPVACKKDAGPAPAMKKVETRADGLPTAPAPKAEAAPGDPHAGMGGTAGMPADGVHGGAMGGGANPHAGVPGMGGMGGSMGGMPGHGVVGEAVGDGHEIPLRKTFLGGTEELARALARVQGDDNKKKFETAFRLTFSMDKSKRDIHQARATFEELLKAQPDLAEAYRGLAYVALQDNFNFQKSEEMYLRALQARPEYGEVHYALAFLYAGGDREKGAVHLKKALELKVPDDQGLGKVYGIEAPAAVPAPAAAAPAAQPKP